MRGLVVTCSALLLGTAFGAAEGQTPATVGIEDFSVGAVTERMDSAEIRNVLGAPDSVVIHENPFDAGGELPTYYFGDLTVHYGYSDTPVGFALIGPGVETRRGLRAGDPLIRARELYGEPSLASDGVWQYADPEDIEEMHVIQVEFVGDRIERIYVGWLID